MPYYYIYYYYFYINVSMGYIVIKVLSIIGNDLFMSVLVHRKTMLLL